jgi:hypothetical protein
MALALPRKFLLEAQRGGSKPFGLLTINSNKGVSDKATTEAHWTAATSESNVDYDATPRDITTNAYRWIASGSGANEYYCELVAGGDPSIPEQYILMLNEAWITKAALGSLGDHEWGYGDNDSLGFTTIYFADATGDPDTEAVIILTHGTPPNSGDVILAQDPDNTTDTDVVYPVSDFASVEVTGDWDDVNAPESDANFLGGGVGTNHSWLGVPDVVDLLVETATIKSVSLTIRSERGSGASDLNPTIRVNGTNYSLGNLTLPPSFGDQTFEWESNPDTNLPWKAGDIATIDAIGFIDWDVSGSTAFVSVVKMFVVYFDFEISGFIEVEFDLTGANTDNDLIVSIDDVVPTGGGLTHELLYPITIDYMRPTGHWITQGVTTNPAFGYNGNDSNYADSPSVFHTDSDRKMIMFGRNVGNTDLWETEPAFTSSATLKVIIERVDLGGASDPMGVHVEDSGQAVYDMFRTKSSFTSDGTVTPVLKSIGIEIPDNVYKFSSLGDDTFGARPIITSLPGRTIKLDAKSFITLPSDLNVGLERFDFIDDLLRQNYFRGLEANVKIGLWREDLTEEDLVPYYSGSVANYSVTESEIILKLRDATKDLSRKWPLGTAPSSPPSVSFDKTHMVDCIRTILDDIAIPDRFVDQGSLDILKATVGQDVSIPLTSSNWVVKRVGTDPDAGGTAILDAEAAREFIGQLLGLMGAYLVTQENGKLTAILYDIATAIVDTWTPDFYDATKYDAALEGLRNAMSLYSDWDGLGDKANDFDTLFITKDSGSITNWGEELERIIKSEWIAGDSSDGYYGTEMAEFITGRETARQADGIGSIPAQTSLVKAGVQVGDFIDVETDLAIKPDIGKGDLIKFFVTKKTWDIENGKINWTLMEAR